jgi:hypothetical protein
MANEIVKRPNNPQVTLKPQDVVVLLKLLVSSGRVLPFAALAEQLTILCPLVVGCAFHVGTVAQDDVHA